MCVLFCWEATLHFLLYVDVYVVVVVVVFTVTLVKEIG